MSQRRLLKLNKGTSLEHRLADKANRLRAAADRAKDFQERLSFCARHGTLTPQRTSMNGSHHRAYSRHADWRRGTRT